MWIEFIIRIQNKQLCDVCINILLLEQENVHAGSDYHQLSTSSSMGELEHSQKLRSLHQVVELTDDTDITPKSNAGYTQLPHHNDHTAANQTREYYDKLGAVENEPNAATSLLRRNTHIHTAGRKYGTTSSTRSRKSTTFKRNILRLQPALFHRFKRVNSKKVTPPVAVSGDRRNEFFALKRLIFMMLGMPNTPAISTRMQKLSSKSSCFKHTTKISTSNEVESIVI